jgi:hypothetical protein
MTEKLIAIYYPYALALSSHDYSGLYTDDIEIVGEWLANNHVKSVEVLKDEKGNFICSEGYCSVCEDYATRMLCKVITE